MDAYLWIDSKTGDAMATERDGTVRKIDLPDEMYEDLLHAKMRNASKMGWILPPAAATPVDPDDELPELEWDDEEVTQPMGFTPEEIWSMQDQWKKDGLCPQCGHKGEWRGMACVCPKHGKFMG